MYVCMYVCNMVDSGLAEFYDPISDLKSWLQSAYQQRAIAIFHVDKRKRHHHDPITRPFIQSEDAAACGQYCLYYNLTPNLPLNETCIRIVGLEPPLDRLFWRGALV